MRITVEFEIDIDEDDFAKTMDDYPAHSDSYNDFSDCVGIHAQEQLLNLLEELDVAATVVRGLTMANRETNVSELYAKALERSKK